MCAGYQDARFRRAPAGKVHGRPVNSISRGLRRCGGHVAVHGRDKYLNLLACGGVALGSQ
jgi:hypothetical protein